MVVQILSLVHGLLKIWLFILPKSNLRIRLLHILEVELNGLNWTLWLIVGNDRDHAASWTGLLCQYARIYKFFFRVHHQERWYLLSSSTLLLFARLTNLIFIVIILFTERSSTAILLIVIIVSSLDDGMLAPLCRTLKITSASFMLGVEWKLTLMVLFLHLTLWPLIKFGNRWEELRRGLAFHMIKVLLLLVSQFIDVKSMLYWFFHQLLIFLVSHEFFFKAFLANNRICL